jgi:hypothetical protein
LQLREPDRLALQLHIELNFTIRCFVDHDLAAWNESLDGRGFALFLCGDPLHHRLDASVHFQLACAMRIAWR